MAEIFGLQSDTGKYWNYPKKLGTINKKADNPFNCKEWKIKYEYECRNRLKKLYFSAR